MWCVADLDEDYIANMEETLETYERPYDSQEPVVCLDEKPVTLHADVRPFSAAQPGREARRDNEYERCGTANVFCAVEPKAGRHFTFPTPDRSGFEFAQVLFQLALAYPAARTIHLVMDNLNIHRKKPLTDLYGAEVGAKSGTGLPSTTRPPTEVGSIRRKSKSGSSPGSVWEPEEYPI
jgi:DDE superfamily endonuclease